MRYLHGSVGVFLVCMATVVDAQVKCNAVSYTVDDGWCKGKSVSFKACYDASKPDTDSQSKAALIKMSQLAEKVYTKDMCLNGAKEMCSWVGAHPKPGTVRMSTMNARETTLPGGFPAPVRQMHSARALQRVAMPFVVILGRIFSRNGFATTLTKRNWMLSKSPLTVST
jgi:hypothetical protein